MELKSLPHIWSVHRYSLVSHFTLYIHCIHTHNDKTNLPFCPVCLCVSPYEHFVSLTTGFKRNTLPFNLSVTVQSIFLSSLSLSHSHHSCLNPRLNSLLSIFFSRALCSYLAALLCLALWRQVVNQKANFCCHCSHLGGHCCAWRPWHFKLRAE